MEERIGWPGPYGLTEPVSGYQGKRRNPGHNRLWLHERLNPELKMKTRTLSTNKFETPSGSRHEPSEVSAFHDERLRREKTIANRKASSTKPEGNYEYEQLIAEDAGLNAKLMIETTAYFIAERRDFAPGQELSDWLQAEAEIERRLRGAGDTN